MAIIQCWHNDTIKRVLSHEYPYASAPEIERNERLFADLMIMEECDTNPDSRHVKFAIGKVLTTRERNGSDDSDFYALIFDGEGLREYEYASTRGWTYHNGAAADATPETIEAANADARRYAASRLNSYYDVEATMPKHDRIVKVVKGRKVPQGTIGTVVWVGEGSCYEHRYKCSCRPAKRIGIMPLDCDPTDRNNRVFTSASNVEVVDPARYRKPQAEIDAEIAATTWAGYHSSLYLGLSLAYA